MLGSVDRKEAEQVLGDREKDKTEKNIGHTAREMKQNIINKDSYKVMQERKQNTYTNRVKLVWTQ